jgi:site-specific DNA recombinase
MTHTYTSKGQRRYRYYVCNNTQQNGRAACPAPSVPAEKIERFIVDEINAIGRDPALVGATLVESRRLAEDGITRLKSERAELERQRRADEAELGNVAAAGGATNNDLTRLAQVQKRIGQTESQLREVEDELVRLMAQDIGEEQVTAALVEFDTVWATLAPSEQARVLALLIERVDHDGKSGNVAITFRPSGLKSLAVAKPDREETAA